MHCTVQVEEHLIHGEMKQLLVHRKGSTRAFPPHHPLIPVDYQLTGQPVLIGGTMGTHSYVLTGTQRGMQETFGSTCHGAGRARSRNNSRSKLDYQQVAPLHMLPQQTLSRCGGCVIELSNGGGQPAGSGACNWDAL